MRRINVTEAFLPPRREFDKYLDEIWQNHHLTNNGPLLRQLEEELTRYLTVSNLQVVTNGTAALQIALQALDITEGEVITTPFSYVASTSAILWQRCTPIFADIDPETFCIDPKQVEAAITPQTKAILAVHVFGNPCDTASLQAIAKRHRLKLIYDAAHAFAVRYQNRSILDYGDVSICSFHATKLFHTIEGGSLTAQSADVRKKIDLMKRFGHNGDNHLALGINAKASEFQAAMGLSNLSHMDTLIAKRAALYQLYVDTLGQHFTLQRLSDGTDYNFAYFPILLESEEHLLETVTRLQDQGIFPRRYFYPSLNTLPYLANRQSCPVSEDIARRILCLPLYADLSLDDARQIAELMREQK